MGAVNVLDPPGDPPRTAAVFRREGDYWTVAYEGRLVHVRDLKGLHYLERLLAHPAREITVEALLAHVPATKRRRGSRGDAGDAERDRKAVTNRIRQAIARIGDLHPELGRHLRISVRTGGRCVYAPERQVHWNEVGV
jgi:hypothetical protein